MKRLGMIFGSLLFLTPLCWLGVSATGLRSAEAKRSFRRHVWPTLRRYCRGCHSPKGRGKKKRPPAGNLNLKTRKLAYNNLVNQLSKQTKSEYYLVMPEQPGLSYLVFKLLGQHKHPNVGGKGLRCPQRKRKGKMVPGRKLATWRIKRIIQWIKGGAKK